MMKYFCGAKIHSRYVKARLCRAKVHEQKGDVKLAYDDYKRALSYEPNNAQARR
jgi:Tfp pilus assembly protein PilF